MRHRLKGRKLGRTASHKKATMRALSIALLTHHRVVTTLPKAKELRRYVEPVITRAKEDSTHNRREVFSFIQDNKTVSKLFDEIGPKVSDRAGGYTRIVKIGYRSGDSADMAVIELVDYNESEVQDTGKKKRTRRAGRGVASKATTAVGDAKSAEVVEEAEVVVSDESPEVLEVTTDQVEETVDETTEVSSETKEDNTDSSEEEKK